MIKDGVPFPNPSRAPEDVTETEETRKPPLIIRRAKAPADIVSWFDVKRLISCPGRIRQMAVPNTIMTAHILRVT